MDITFNVEKDKIHLLHPKDFKNGKLINNKISHGITTIMIFANWCGHCHSNKPVYSEIAKMARCQSNCAALNSDHKDVTSVKIDGYPTFLQYKNGEYWRTSKVTPNSDGERFTSFVCGTENY
jgi:thiol-disulfide isomerase/thioredoxin